MILTLQEQIRAFLLEHPDGVTTEDLLSKFPKLRKLSDSKKLRIEELAVIEGIAQLSDGRWIGAKPNPQDSLVFLRELERGDAFIVNHNLYLLLDDDEQGCVVYPLTGPYAMTVQHCPDCWSVKKVGKIGRNGLELSAEALELLKGASR